MFISVLWTILKTKEYSPEQLAAFEQAQTNTQSATQSDLPVNFLKGSAVSGFIGVIVLLAVALLGLEKELYLLSGLLIAFAIVFVIAHVMQQKQRVSNGFYHVIFDLFTMPKTMQQLAVVQFFSWFSLFAMWIYTTSAVTSHHYGTSDVTSKLYNDGADWVGVLFAAYNGFAAIAAMVIPFMVKRIGLKGAHAANLFFGAVSLISFKFIADPTLLWLPMVGIGFAWASILSLPYAMLSNALPSNKMGVFMGIFNFFIVIPQLLAASILGLILRHGFDNQPIFALVIGGVSFLLAALAVSRVTIKAQ